MVLPWDEGRMCEWTARTTPLVRPEERVRTVQERTDGDLIAAIVEALAPFEEARSAVAEAMRVFMERTPCPG